MRKLLAVLFLVAVAVALWYGGRWFAGNEALQATLVFDREVELRKGDPVLHHDVVIGAVDQVSRLRNRQAVEIRVDREQRHLVRTDSSFTPSPRGRALSVGSGLAVGPPLADGAVVHVQASQLAEWMNRGAAAFEPLKKKATASKAQLTRYVDETDFEASLAEWKEKVPLWKQQGNEVYERNLSNVRVQVAEAEAQLRQAKKNVEADRLRARFDAWMQSVRD